MSLVSGCAICLLLCAADPANELRFDSALLTLIEHAEVSASEAGLILQLDVKEGDTVAEGQSLARIDDRDTKLIHARADAEVKAARTFVDNDVKIRFAKLSAAVAKAELLRATESNIQLPKSVSQAEIDRLRLFADKADLEIEQADVERQQSKLSLEIKQQELLRASLALDRRTISAPFPGMVVQLKKHRGEWVEPGVPIMRLIRLNRVRAEVFAASQKLPADLVGRSATLIANPTGKQPIKRSGTLVFVSPEIDPVNGQVRLWAEIENDDLRLRPGQTGVLTIGPSNP